MAGSETINRLGDFYNKVDGLEKEYKDDAMKFIKHVLEVNSYSDPKKDLTELLINLGFKKSNVSKMIGATEFTLQLEANNSEATEWVKTLPVSTTYVLSTCEEKTFNKVWAQESEWGSKSVTQKQIESLKQKEQGKKFPQETLKTYTAPEPTPKPEPRSLEDLEYIRNGVNPDQRNHYESLIDNSNLGFIDSPTVAVAWGRLTEDHLIKLVRQKLEVGNSSFETQLRELLEHHNEQTVDVVCTQEDVFNNKVDSSGIRWRR